MEGCAPDTVPVRHLGATLNGDSPANDRHGRAVQGDRKRAAAHRRSVSVGALHQESSAGETLDSRVTVPPCVAAKLLFSPRQNAGER